MKARSITKTKNAYLTYGQPTDKQPFDTRQVKNAAGGFVYRPEDFSLLRRLLVLGTKHGSYYLSGGDMTSAFADVVNRCAAISSQKVAMAILDVYESGMYLDEEAVLFAMSILCSSKSATARADGISLIKNLRTGTAFLTFCSMMNTQRGWGRAIRNAISGWYNRDVDKVAYQILKYQSRSNWSHRDVLRKAHVVPLTVEHNVLFSYIVDGWGEDWQYKASPEAPFKFNFAGTIGNVNPKKTTRKLTLVKTNSPFLEQIAAYERVKTDIYHPIVKEIVDHKLTIEMIPTERRTLPVWQNLMYNMPLGSLIRNLNKLSSENIFSEKAEGTAGNVKFVVGQLTDMVYMRRARIHPVDLYLASTAYRSGTNRNMSWIPNREIVDALEQTLNGMLSAPVDDTIKAKLLIAIDHSGSMDSVGYEQNFSPLEAAALSATYLASKFSNADVISFSCNGVINRLTLGRDVHKNFQIIANSRSAGGTACSDVLDHAMVVREKYDAIIILTDSETWASQRNLRYAVTNYRQQKNSEMRFVNMAMVGNTSSLADPLDLKDMELCGFDTALFKTMESFVSGEGIWGKD